MADDRHEDEGIEETVHETYDDPHESYADQDSGFGDDALADEFATNLGGDDEDHAALPGAGPRFDDDEDGGGASDDDDDDDDDYDEDDGDDGYDGDEDDEEGWGGNTGIVDGVEEEASFACPSCGEEIVIPIDISEGTEQELTEDCPVCCNPNVITITIDDAGDITVEAESESD